MNQAQPDRLEAELFATAECCGVAFSLPAARMIRDELKAYSPEQVSKALRRCRREITGRLTLAAILDRIDDGRPTADEAWAAAGTRDESRTVVTTDEALEALGEVRILLESDEVAARMAFRDAYKRIVTQSKESGRQPVWMPSLGTNPAGRAAPVLRAVEQGRLTHKQAELAIGALPGRMTQPQLAASSTATKLIAGLALGPSRTTEQTAEIAQLIAEAKQATA